MSLIAANPVCASKNRGYQLRLKQHRGSIPWNAYRYAMSEMQYRNRSASSQLPRVL